jgi:hypothetical protein
MAAGKLAEEAKLLSVNKNLNDVTTLLVWAHDAGDATEKAKHIERAILLLTDVRDQLVPAAETAKPAGPKEDEDFVFL